MYSIRNKSNSLVTLDDGTKIAPRSEVVVMTLTPDSQLLKGRGVIEITDLGGINGYSYKVTNTRGAPFQWEKGVITNHADIYVNELTPGLTEAAGRGWLTITPIGNSGGGGGGPEVDPTVTATMTNTLGAATGFTGKGANVQVVTVGTLGTVFDVNASEASKLSVKTMVGATAGSAGVRGLVPNSLAGDENKYLKADGTWAVVPPGVNPATAVSPKSDAVAGAVGTSALYAREDHKHPAQTPSADANNSLVVGTDGLHFFDQRLNAATLVSPAADDAVGAVGTATKFAREDHKHAAQDVSADANNALVVGTDGLHFFNGWPRHFLTNTIAAPAVAGRPSVAEVAAVVTVAERNKIVYYTGTDTSTDAPTYVFHVDKDLAVTQLDSPTYGMVGSTSVAAGVSGSVPTPAAGSQNQFLRGDATFGSALPLWATTTKYTVGDVVRVNDVLFRATATHTAGATFEGDLFNWKFVSGANIILASGATHTVVSTDEVIVAETPALDVSLPYATSANAQPLTIVGAWSPSCALTLTNQMTDTVTGSPNITVPLGATVTAYPFNSGGFGYWVVAFPRGEMGAATHLVASKPGIVPQSTIGAQNQFLKGNATFGSSVPSWATATRYTSNDVVYDPATNKIYACVATHLAGATFGGDRANWKELSPAVVAGHNQASAYVQGETVIYHGYDVIANDAITAGTAFAWGTTGATWSPILNSGATWQGVFVNTSGYAVNDVVFDPVAATLLRVTSVVSIGETPQTHASKFEPWGSYETPIYSGATATAAGQEGLVPPAAAGSQNKFLQGSGVYSSVFPAWASGASYTAEDFVYYNDKIYKANTTHASGVSFDLDLANWNLIHRESIIQSGSPIVATHDTDLVLVMDATTTIDLPAIEISVVRPITIVNALIATEADITLTSSEGIRGGPVITLGAQRSMVAYPMDVGGAYEWLIVVGATKMIGATDTVDGVEGSVPQPLMADVGKFLSADATWMSVYANAALYNSGVAYKVGDLVRDANNTTWLVTADHTSVSVDVDATNARTIDGSVHQAIVPEGTALFTMDPGLTGVIADATTTPQIITLPPATNRRLVFIKRSITNTANVTIGGAGTDTIDGYTAVTLSVAGEAVTLVSDGVSDWKVITRPSALVPVADLHYLALSGDASSNITTGNGVVNSYQISALSVRDNTGNMLNAAGNNVIVQQSGKYRLFFTGFESTDAHNGVIVKNGSTLISNSQYAGADVKFPTVIDTIVDLASGDILSYRDEYGFLTNHRGLRIVVQQLPDKSVVLPDVVQATVTDQASSGYFDIGNMRIQWGELASSTTNTVSLPAAFANTTYSVIAQNMTNTAAAIHVSSRTTTTFIVTSFQTTNAAPVAVPKTWMAVGIKP
jgi:hypothetical protein